MVSEPAKPNHGRRLALSGISLTKAKIGDAGLALNGVRDELESLLDGCGYLAGAPFSWVTISLRFGLKHEQAPHYQGINKKYGDLALAIELGIKHERWLRDAPRMELIEVFRRASLIALVHAGRKYDRPVARLEAELHKMSG